MKLILPDSPPNPLEVANWAIEQNVGWFNEFALMALFGMEYIIADNTIEAIKDLFGFKVQTEPESFMPQQLINGNAIRIKEQIEKYDIITPDIELLTPYNMAIWLEANNYGFVDNDKLAEIFNISKYKAKSALASFKTGKIYEVETRQYKNKRTHQWQTEVRIIHVLPPKRKARADHKRNSRKDKHRGNISIRTGKPALNYSDVMRMMR